MENIADRKSLPGVPRCKRCKEAERLADLELQVRDTASELAAARQENKALTARVLQQDGEIQRITLLNFVTYIAVARTCPCLRAISR
jgi:hypothetical protein